MQNKPPRKGRGQKRRKRKIQEQKREGEERGARNDVSPHGGAGTEGRRVEGGKGGGDSRCSGGELGNVKLKSGYTEVVPNTKGRRNKRGGVKKKKRGDDLTGVCAPATIGRREGGVRDAKT